MKTKLIIFGISGDLSRRKLLPALREIVSTGEFNDLDIIGVSRREIDLAELLHDAPELLPRSSMVTMDMANAADYERLKSHVALGQDEQLLVYLSVPPGASSQIVALLGEAGLNTPNVKLLLEKPFGVDLASAEAMQEHIAQHYDDQQVYRIDHYLAKEMAQNIVAFRAGNALFSHVWNGQAIESIEVIATETIGIEGRGEFYEQTGALRDVMQGHLMQLLSLVLMDVPGEVDWDAVPSLRLAALRQLQPADPQLAVRAQYTGYAEEAGNPRSQTETFASVQLVSNDPRWQGTALRLTAGKALDKKTTEIVVSFKKSHDAQPNKLVFRIQPNEGVEIDLFAKQPGYDRQMAAQQLAFTYPPDATLPDAYEHVLVEAIRSRKSLFTSGQEVRESWRVLQPVLDVWAMDAAPLRSYQKASGIDDTLR